MKSEFTSGDLQNLLNVQKRRIEYLLKEIPIKPEIKRVEGTGRSHLYSFRNVLQFAIAQDMSHTGLAMSEIRMVLGLLDNASVIIEGAATPPFEIPAKQADKGIYDMKMAFVDGREGEGRKYLILLYNPEQTYEAYKNYFSSEKVDDLFFIIGSSADRRDSHRGKREITISITASLDDFSKDLSGYAATALVLLDLGKLKERTKLLLE